jgi:penicillin-binding protein 1A
MAMTGTYLYLSPRLPSVDVLRDVRDQEPLRVYSNDGLLMGEFGEMRRTPVRFDQVPERMIQAFLAAEDDRFLVHGGIDIPGLIRAAWELATTHSIQSGGSTITMQVARNYFLTREQSFMRKFTEILLALRIERELDKHQILELYLNKIFLGYRAYGVEAAAQVYYGRSIRELSLSESAMIAGLPKAPSTGNPLENPARALERRNWILGRMLDLGYIPEPEYRQALAEPLTVSYHGSHIELDADYAAEMVRAEMIHRYGTDAYTGGFVVQTTIEGKIQRQAQAAVIGGLLAYDQRHGWRGAERHLEEPASAWPAVLAGMPPVAGLEAAIVTEVGDKSISLQLANGSPVSLGWEQGLSTARPYISSDYRGPLPKTAAEVVRRGDVVRLQTKEDGSRRLAQVPAVQGAMVSLDGKDGGILALVGGLDFRQSKFNRAAQALRQPGSNIKPFIYAAAMEHGFTPASMINDAPVVFQDPGLEKVWRPENDSGKFYGPTSLRNALVNSRNLVSIRLLQQLGIPIAVDYLAALGFQRDSIPPNLSLALGTLVTTPLQVASAYAALANGGYRVQAHLVREIRRVSGEVLERPEPLRACPECTSMAQPSPAEPESIEKLVAQGAGPSPAPPVALAPRVMDPRAAYMIDSILKEAVKRGTGRRAMELKRDDIAGKTGTTNGPMDAWFSGYVGTLVTTAWLGFDQNTPLGKNEFGGSAAVPVWVAFMREVVRDLPHQERPRPEGLVSVRVDPQTGLLAAPGQGNAIFELFPLENVPSVTPDGDEYQDPYTPDEYNTHEIF